MSAQSLGSRIIAKLRYWATLHTYFVAILCGITSLSFDFKRQKIGNSKRLVELYGVIINITLLIAAPIVHGNIVNHASFYKDNLQMKLINVINLHLRTVTTLMILILRWRTEIKMKQTIERLIVLEQEYFERVSYPQQLITKFDKLFMLKFGSIRLLILAGLYVVYRYVNHTFPWWHATILYTVISMNILHGVVLHYFMCLLHIASRFVIVNFRLKEIYKTLKKPRAGFSLRSNYLLQKSLAAEVDYITCIHFKLMNVVAELNDCYKYHLLINLVAHVFNNIAMGYYDIILCYNYKKFNLTYYDFILGGFTYCGLILDLYLVDVGCSILENSYYSTGASLKKFNQFFDMEAALYKSCDLLSLHLAQEKLKTRICGMFILNKETSFLILSFTLSQVLFLIQSDIANSINV